MSYWVAALPMYDWPEARAETDAEWAALRDALRRFGLNAPDRLARRNGDFPPVPGGIRDAHDRIVAPDPAALPPDEFDLDAVWRHPDLLLAQTCWGPLEQGLSAQVQVVGQPDYSEFEGGQGPFYSSVVLMARGRVGKVHREPLPFAQLPLHLLHGRRLAFNGPDSMSGLIALSRDLEAAGESLAVFSERIETGAHRSSLRTVAEGRADVCAVDCRSWALATRHEPAARELVAVGWTRKRLGLPFIASRRLPAETIAALQAALQASNRASSG